jgi:hypothetical protein
MRVFRAIVQPFVPTMLTVGQCSANCWRVAGELVGDHDPRLGAVLSVKHTMQETLSGDLIAPVLNEDVQHDAVLINGSPQPMAFAADPQRHLVHMPLVAGASTSSTQLCGEGGSELGAPLSDRLVAHDDPAFGEEILNVTEAEMEAEVQPDGVSDDLGREAVAAIGGGSTGSATDIRRRLSLIPGQLDNS